MTLTYANVLLALLMPVLIVYALVMLFKTGKPKRLWLLIVTLTPIRPSHGLTHLFPGVETPPDPAHSNAVASEVDRRPPKPLPGDLRDR